MHRRCRGHLAVALTAASAAAPAPALAAPAELVGRATHAATAPRTGATIAGYPGQPVGGYSALIRGPAEGEFFALPDNGYGTKATSRDFVLRIDRVRVSWRTESSGAGSVQVLERVHLTDPDRRVPWTITDANGVADRAWSARSPNPNPWVPDSGRRLLTGADFDPESIRRAADGSFWIGDEVGPFLLHTTRSGRLLEAPIPAPGLRTPDSPVAGTATLGSSRGFEGLAKSGSLLFAVTEGPVAGTDPARRPILQYDMAARAWTRSRWTYCTSEPGHAVAELSAMDAARMVVLERDDLEGGQKAFAKVFRIDLREADATGCLVKREVADLLAIADPHRISLLGPVRSGDLRLGDPFGLPYWTTETALPLGSDALVVVNDTNFGGRGRNPGRSDYTDVTLLRQPGLLR